MQTRPGLTLRSSASSAEVVVVRAASADVEIRCADEVMTADAVAAEGAAAGDPETAILVGKRYADEQTGLELLCTKPGSGPLSCNGRVLSIKGTKPLPASD